MPVQVGEISAAIETWAPLGLASEWDRSGLAVGDPAATVRRVLVCLTPCRGAFESARKTGANLLVSHHPLIWEPLRALRTDDPYTRLCLDFAAEGIACYSAHTNLDHAPGGVNHLLAAALGLAETAPLFPAETAEQVKLVTFVPESHLEAVREAVSDAGAGKIGDYTHCSFSTAGVGTFLPGKASSPYTGTKGCMNEKAERRFETLVLKARLPVIVKALFSAHPYEEVAYDVIPLENRDQSIGLGLRGMLEKPARLDDFAEAVRRALRLRHLRYCGDRRRKVLRVAVLGGAGGGEAARIPGDIDVYVTGDVKYHDACTALDRGLSLIDAGHAGTERIVVPALARFLRRRFPDLSVSVFNEPELFIVTAGE